MRRRRAPGWLGTAACVAALVAGPPRAVAQMDTVEALRRELETMKRQMKEMQQQMKRREETIRALEAKEAAAPTGPAAEKPATAAAALDRALEEAKAAAPAPAGPALAAQRVGGATLRLIDTSFDILFAAGASTAGDAEIALLEGGAHDPRRRGFTLQQGELSLAGAVDPYFTGEAHVVFTDEDVELEEAFFTTTSLPWGLQLKGGYFFTEFGRINSIHPHAWNWLDQPIVNSRLFGGEGLRNPGARLGWLLPVPWFSELYLGAQNASGETAASFLGEERVAGRPLVDRDVRNPSDLLYLGRWEHAWLLGDTWSTKLGGSALFGPNASGPDGRTRIYGGDFLFKWRPATNFRGWPFLSLQTEVMQRDYEADGVARAPALGATTLHDWGLYTQALYGFRYGWAGGLRYEYASGSGQSVGGRAADAFRDDRHRVSPLMVWRASEFSRMRLQYNWDRADHLAHGDAHSVWLGFELLYGAHAAHKY